VKAVTDMDRLKGRLILCQWATYITKGYKSISLGEIESLSPMSRQDAYLSVQSWLAYSPFVEAGFQSHCRGWYKNTKGSAVESLNEPEKFRCLRLVLEEMAAVAVLEILE